ncbi:MAG TPA: carboxypeptidase-like regulatory domain-containing protein, partial [Pyrinomonadaceae bacterium]|nr:carboxypeptidase-like regulatory domain-containing protein [Pyrinomonadaceae bacterium]
MTNDKRHAVLNFALRTLTSALLLAACASRAGAQGQAAPTPTPERVRPRGSITGRVVGEDGQPVNGARAFVRASRSGGDLGGSAITGPDGAFKIEGLEVAPYGVTAQVPGAFDAAYLEYERGARVYYRPGDDVSIRVMRGGVITGRITDARGEPAAGVRVNLVRVRTLEGSHVREVNRFMGSLERMTDDRGVYRSYGLLPGVYVVSAGGRFSGNFFGVIAHADEAPTFYPSATRDATTEVTVRAGEEVGAVDVRLRGERGHAVSGTVAGVNESSHAEQATTLNIISADTTEYVERVYINGRAETEGFSIDGLTDGDYDLVADRFSTKDWRRVASSARRVQVRGADVTGLRVTFAPLSSLAGRLVFETPPASDSKPS